LTTFSCLFEYTYIHAGHYIATKKAFLDSIMAGHRHSGIRHLSLVPEHSCTDWFRHRQIFFVPVPDCLAFWHLQKLYKDGNGYTRLDTSTLLTVDSYTLQVYTTRWIHPIRTYCWLWKGIHPIRPSFGLWKGIHPAYPSCWLWKGIHPAYPSCWL
jgi:hypothetical protein